MVTIQHISPRHPLYPQVCDLRETVLLRPLGLDMQWFRTYLPDVEARAEFVIATVEHPDGTRVVGCAGLLADDDNPAAGRLMQMAVDPQRQGEGIGRRLLVALESRAFGELGFQELYCHAQLRAAGFYAAMGWQTDSEVFEEAGIPHIRMAIRQPVEEDQSA